MDHFPAGLVNYIILYGIFTVEEVFKTNVSIIPFEEACLCLLYHLGKKKMLPRENSFFFLQSSLIETIGSIDTLQIFQIFVTLVKVSILFPLKEILHY